MARTFTLSLCCAAVALPVALLAQQGRTAAGPQTAPSRVIARHDQASVHRHRPEAELRGGSIYCTPSYTTGTTDGDFIDGVTLGDISNLSSGGDTVYTLYGFGGPGTVTRLVPGMSYDLGITAGTYADVGGEAFEAWIDYNGNDVFDTTESLGQLFTTTAGQIGTISFTVPADAPSGYTMLRVRDIWTTAAPTAPIDPCAEYGYGETEDYVVLIDGGEPCIPLLNEASSDGDYVSAVVLNDLNTTGASQPLTAYTNNLGIGAMLDQGADYTITITSGEYNGSLGADYLGAWIDWNFDGDWDDPGEQLGVQAATGAFGTVSFSFTVPAETFGYTKLRVRNLYDAADMTACADGDFGETEDYTIAVQDAALWACLPVNGGTQYGDQIASVDFLGQTYSEDSGWPYYSWWNDPSIHLQPGTSQTMSITSGDYDGDRFHLYLDANNDNDFDDAGEDLGYVDNTTSNEVMPLNFTVPASCTPGQHFMRLRVHYAFDPDAACASTYYGETQDFVVAVENPDGPCIPYMSIWTTDGDFIDGVELGTISNTGTGGDYGPAYNDYTSQSTELGTDSAYTLTVTSGEYDDDSYAAWIDYNADGDWDDPDELLGEVEASGSEQALQINFTVPNGIPLGGKRMRVRCYDGAGLTACEDYDYGETEDYTVEITAATSVTEAGNSEFTVLPDPGHVQVQVLGEASRDAQIMLLDATGRVLHRKQATGDRTTIDMKGMANGAYVILLGGANGQHSQRFSWVAR